MQHNTRPKLFPPKALLWAGPLPYQRDAQPDRKPGSWPELTRTELRAAVLEMID
jgi:hypothetical protein